MPVSGCAPTPDPVVPNPETAARRVHWIVAIALTAAAYYASGRLGLLLAIPPGYATAVWPPSGIALAALLVGGRRCWPGVWLGSMLINLPTGFAAGDFSLGESLWVPAAIATGATLQALLGEWLIERFVGYDDLLDQETDVIPLLVLGGPVACLVNAFVGVGTLHFADKIAAEGLLVNWGTWWIGDTIGVLVVTPLVLLWSKRPWVGGPASRIWVSVPLVTLVTLVVVIFVTVSRRESSRLQAEFDGWNAEFEREAGEQLELTVDGLAALRGLFGGGRTIERAEFDGVAEALMQRNQDLLGLSWNPAIAPADAAAFESAGRADYGPGFALQEFAATSSDKRFPVRFITPLLGNAPALGLDTGSDPARNRALTIAAENGREALTGPVALIQDPERKPGLLLVLPVAREREPLAGYVIAVLHAEDLIRPPAKSIESRQVHVKVTDASADGALLYETPGAMGRGGFRHEKILPIAGRRWHFETALPEAALLERRSWETWGVLAGGLLFTGLLGMFLMVVVGRGRRVEALIERRTIELTRSNSELMRELLRGEKLQQETQRRAADLAAVNRELELFAYIVSHVLQAPLRTIGSFAQLMERKYTEVLDARGREYLGLIKDGVGEMQKLIEALLRMSRISRGRLKLDVVQVAPLIARVCEQLRADIEQSGADVTCDDLPRVYADPELLSQVFLNLIGNAIKFRRPHVPPRVRVSATTEDSEWRFSISDNGTGLSPQNVERLFQVFRRFHAASQYPGTGIGLALSRKIVQLHGGRIWAESVEGQGTTFHFSLPLESVQSA
jgi:signal transduction histidine kinase